MTHDEREATVLEVDMTLDRCCRSRAICVAPFAVGFGLGTWYGASRTVGQIRRHVGQEKWDRGKGKRPERRPARRAR